MSLGVIYIPDYTYNFSFCGILGLKRGKEGKKKKRKKLKKINFFIGPELPAALRLIPLVTYWVIHTIVASKIELSTYLSETE